VSSRPRSNNSPSPVRRGALVATDPRNPPPSSLATRAVMSANRGRDTSPELELRRALRRQGVRAFRSGVATVAGRPDLVFLRPQVAVYVHGCFWHRCPTCRLPLPRSNRHFWIAKFRRNRVRDRQKRRLLEGVGWRVVELWSHELERDADQAARTIARVVLRQVDLRTRSATNFALSQNARRGTLAKR
jgi:DNA mismatch endonuclease (patch repair protein)